MTEHVVGLLLAAGSSRRLGQPKQLLPYRGRTLLDATLDVARAAPFSQRLVTVGGAAVDVLHAVDFHGFEVVDSLHFTNGCSSSIVSALDVVPPQASGIVMLLGDQPGVTAEAIELLITAATAGGEIAPLAVCNYRDGVGHPFWFGRQVFGDLAQLHGDKAVWKLLESGAHPVTHVPIDAPIPLDVDTWDDYEALLAPRRGHTVTSFVSVEELKTSLDGADYLVDEGLATALYLAQSLGQPLLLEGEPGVGKTAAAKAMAQALNTPLLRLQCYEGIAANEALYEWNYPRQLLAIRMSEADGQKLTDADLFTRRLSDRATAVGIPST